MRGNDFEGALDSFLDSYYRLMRSEDSALIGARTVAFMNFPSWFPPLVEMMTRKKLAAFVSKLVSDVPFCDKRTFNVQKMYVLSSLANSVLSVDPETRPIVGKVVVEQVILLLELENVSAEERRECVATIFVLVEVAQRLSDEPMALRELYVVHLLPYLIALVDEFQADAESTLDSVMCVLAILRLCDAATFALMLKAQPSRNRQLAFVVSLCRFLSSLLLSARASFPENWFALQMFLADTVVHTATVLLGESELRTIVAELQASSRAIRDAPNKRVGGGGGAGGGGGDASAQPQRELVRSSVVQGVITGDVDSLLVMAFEEYIKLMVNGITFKALALEHFSDAKRRMVTESFPDFRLVLLSALTQAWEKLKLQQLRFISQLVGPFLELVMVKERSIRECGLDLYFSILEREFQRRTSFVGVESQTIDALDKIINEGLGSEANVGVIQDFRDFFVGQLGSRFEHSGNQPLAA
ncbi:MAG TPA: hypothetical protein VJB16_01145, partial [archaeon]|nr:hypothetical protein [archaeon]